MPTYSTFAIVPYFIPTILLLHYSTFVIVHYSILILLCYIILIATETQRNEIQMLTSTIKNFENTVMVWEEKNTALSRQLLGQQTTQHNLTTTLGSTESSRNSAERLLSELLTEVIVPLFDLCSSFVWCFFFFGLVI